LIDVVDALSETADTFSFTDVLLGGGGGGGADCGALLPVPPEEEFPFVISCVFCAVARLDFAWLKLGSDRTAPE